MYAEISNPMDYKVALYIRLSKEDEQKHSHENESQSVLNQRSMLLDYVQRQRLNVIDEYIDDGWSGGNL